MNLRETLHQFSFRCLPGRCILCDARADRPLDICASCDADLPRFVYGCPYCAEPSDTDLPCAACLRSRPVFSAALCGFEYRFPVDVLIHQFKDSRRLVSGQVLTCLAIRHHARSLGILAASAPLVVPVPLHPERQRQRGFNQSEYIARHLAHSLGLTIDAGLLKRLRPTSEQKRLAVKQRASNLAGAFHLTRPLAGEQLLLVDDVITTGATVSEIATCLITGGAADVVVFSLARTPALTGYDKVRFFS